MAFPHSDGIVFFGGIAHDDHNGDDEVTSETVYCDLLGSMPLEP